MMIGYALLVPTLSHAEGKWLAKDYCGESY